MTYTDGSTPIDDTDDQINSEDVIQRIAHLVDLEDEDELDESDAKELSSLRELEIVCKSLGWNSGVNLIRYSYFEEFVKDDCEELYDFGDLPSFIKNAINWVDVSAAMSTDFSTVEWGGITYYVR